MSFLSKDVGVDLGTANTLVYMKGKGIIMREPSVVAVDTKTDEVRCVGAEAKAVIGRTPGSIVAVRPLKDGVIADFDITANMLENFLKNCNYSWNEIAPDNFSGSLPNIFLNPIRLNGTEIPAEMVTTRFAISQEKAFSLLQGSRIYNNHFTFLRELIQNACDAVKLQYWEDYSSSTLAGNTCSAEPQKANASIALSKYPIFIYLSVKKQKRGSASELSDITSEDLKNIEKLKESYKFGVLLEVQDFGIGISKNDIKEIAKVGTSHARQKNFIQKMPPWLRPTGHFGVGL